MTNTNTQAIKVTRKDFAAKAAKDAARLGFRAVRLGAAGNITGLAVTVYTAGQWFPLAEYMLANGKPAGVSGFIPVTKARSYEQAIEKIAEIGVKLGIRQAGRADLRAALEAAWAASDAKATKTGKAGKTKADLAAEVAALQAQLAELMAAK